MYSDIYPQVQIGYFTLDNAANNATAMEELQRLLARRGVADEVEFNHQNNRVRCYAHIVNICASHIIAASTTVPKSYLTRLKIPFDPSYATQDDLGSDDESSCSDGDGDSDNDQDYKLELPACYDRRNNSDIKEWIKGMERDPLKRARRVIRLLRSSDEHRIGFQKLIQDGNEGGLFTRKGSNGKRSPITVPALQLLRDVKTRWDSVYLMLLRLRVLRPVSWSQRLQWDSEG